MKIKDLDKYTNAEKILLAEELWESVSKEKLELSDAMKQELDRRISLVEEDKTEFYTWEDVKNTLKKTEMHKLVFSKEALFDIEQIALWYEEQREGLSYDFELCLEESISQIFRNPELFQVRYINVKVRFIKRFPYGVHYLINLDKIIVIGIFHTSRSPIDWSKRLK